MKRQQQQARYISKKLKPNIENKNCSNSIETYFKDIIAYVLPASFGNVRLNIFKSNIEKYGGILYDKSIHKEEKVTHILVEESIDKDKLTKLFDVNKYSSSMCIKCTWISKCIKLKRLIEPDEIDIIFKCNKETIKNSEIELKTIEKKVIICPIEASISNTSNSNEKKPENETKFVNKFVCAHASSCTPVNHNKLITDELERLASVYESKKDTWRAVGYQKAISAIKNYGDKIETWEQARSVRGVGERLANKVFEIVQSGKLRKADELCEDEETKTLQLFMGVWGAGTTAARNWYIQGYRTLEDLKEKANVTRHQKIGLEYYDEFNERMEREEVALIGEEVKSAALDIKAGLLVEICGSYRRGKATCGDVDVLITHPDGESHQKIFMPILEELKKREFITDDLVTQEHNGNQQKYLGVCKLPGKNKHRRLDILVVPYNEFAPAIMYFTGSAHFNRSMRLLATKMGMSLSEHSLRSGIVRDVSKNEHGVRGRETGSLTFPVLILPRTNLKEGVKEPA